MVMTHTHTHRNSTQRSVGSKDRVETNGRTNGRTDKETDRQTDGHMTTAYTALA